MAFAAWEAGQLPLEPAGFPLSDWPRLVGDVPTIGRGVTLAMPCVGLDALSVALAELRWPGPHIVKYAFDIDPELVAPLWSLHGPPIPGAVFKIGAAGNILEEDISQWDRVDGTCAGPPCPPFSVIGSRQGNDDPRAAVHARVTDILVDQGWKHSFFFIVEQVPGMMTRPSTASGDCSRSCWEDWIQELERWAPMWRVFPWHVNTSAWLPQNRPRMYTIGLHASLARGHLLPPPTPARPCSLKDILHPGLPRIREDGLTPQQCDNLAVAKAQAKRYPECLATVSLDRNPSAKWSTGFGVHGTVMALRTGNDLIWLLQHDGLSDRCKFSRCLHPMERCALQGFRAEQLAGLSKSGVLRTTGNAMSVPVVAAAFKRCMEVLVARLGVGVSRAIPQRDQKRKMRRVAIKLLREHIALLESQEALLRRMSGHG